MNERLKIGFVCVDDACDVASWSGTPYYLLQAFKRQGISIELFSPLEQTFRYVYAPIKIAARFVNKDVIFNHYSPAMRSYATQLTRRIQSNPVDVILSVGTQPITMLECEQPIVFYTDAIFHMMPGYYGGMWDRLTRRAIKRGIWQEEKALRNCAIGVYSSNWAAEGARKFAAPDKIRVIPFGSSMPVNHDLATVRQWAAERITRKPSECRLLFIGVDWIRKGGAIAVETARLLNELGVNTRLTIVGCQPHESIPEYVEAIGFIDKRSSEGRKKLAELYRHANFFILPTKAEASAIVYCEASAFGVPTVTFKTGGAEDYVREGINGICLPLDSEPMSFATHIKEIFDNKVRYAALCLGGFHEYKTRLNWDSAASSLVKLCREAVERRTDFQRLARSSPGTSPRQVDCSRRETHEAISEPS